MVRARGGGGDGEAAERLYELVEPRRRPGCACGLGSAAAEAGIRLRRSTSGTRPRAPSRPTLSAAERWYRRALEGGEVHAANNLARVLRRMDRDEEAEPVYRRGIELGDEIAAVNLAALLRERRPGQTRR